MSHTRLQTSVSVFFVKGACQCSGISAPPIPMATVRPWTEHFGHWGQQAEKIFISVVNKVNRQAQQEQ